MHAFFDLDGRLTDPKNEATFHITLDDADDAPKMMALNTESEGKVVERIGICITCVQENILDADSTSKGQGPNIFRKLARNAICTKCLAERGYVVEPFLK